MCTKSNDRTLSTIVVILSLSLERMKCRLRTDFVFGSVRSSVQKLPLDRDRTERTERLRGLVRFYRSSTALLRTTVVQYVVPVALIIACLPGQRQQQQKIVVVSVHYRICTVVRTAIHEKPSWLGNAETRQGTRDTSLQSHS